MSDNIPKYKATDKMSDLICENYIDGDEPFRFAVRVRG